MSFILQEVQALYILTAKRCSIGFDLRRTTTHLHVTQIALQMNVQFPIHWLFGVAILA